MSDAFREGVNACVAITLWLVVCWRGWRATLLTEVWWSCLLFALVATLRIAPNARFVDQLLGGVWLTIPVVHLALVIALLVTVQWQIVARHGVASSWLKATAAGLFVASAGLFGTWLTVPGAALPSPDRPISTIVHGYGPILTAHWLLYYGLVLLAGLVIALSGVEAARQLTGGMRQSVVAMATTGGLFALYAFDGLLVQLGLLDELDALALPAAIGPECALVVFALAVSIPLGSRPGAGHENDDSRTYADLGELASWLSGSPSTQLTTHKASESGLFDAVVTVRDEMLDLQRWVKPQTLMRAKEAAEWIELDGTDPSAYITARCLTEALFARENGHAVQGKVDLARLGGGETLDQEISWLAAVWRAAAAPDPDTERTGPTYMPTDRRRRWSKRHRHTQVWVRRPALRFVLDAGGEASEHP